MNEDLKSRGWDLLKQAEDLKQQFNQKLDQAMEEAKGAINKEYQDALVPLQAELDKINEQLYPAVAPENPQPVAVMDEASDVANDSQPENPA